MFFVMYTLKAKSSLSRTILFLEIMASITSCGGLHRSESERIRKRNCKGEVIARNEQNISYLIQNPKHVKKTPYPWESDSNLPKITKDYFRCKGSSLNSPVPDKSDSTNQSFCIDCSGGMKHGLPVIHGKEGVYPILVNLLNYIQKKTGKRVIITSGHRCPMHNAYVDSSKENRTSKHQIGAQVNFYVQGMEDRPLEVVGLLMQYYQEHPTDKEYKGFTRYTKADSSLANPPWMNKEIYIKLFQKDEGRNFDNRHPHPYIDVQVRFDQKKQERIVYSWEKANKGYSRGS